MSEAVDAMYLCEQAEAVTATAGFIYDHAQDSDKADELCLLLAALRDAKQALAEVYSEVEKHLLSMDTPRSFEVVGLGLVERKRKAKRSAWDHAAVKHELLRYAATNEVNPVDVIWAAMNPTWRVTALKGFGLQPDEYCQEEWGGESVMLPARDLLDRGKSFGVDAA